MEEILKKYDIPLCEEDIESIFKEFKRQDEEYCKEMGIERVPSLINEGGYRYQYSYVPLAKVMECPEEYIIPECQSACEAFWNKGIETFMVSNEDDNCLYVLVRNLSEYNENRMKKMIEKYPNHYYFDLYRETYGIYVLDKSEESVEKLKVLTAPFKIQDTTRYKTPDIFLDEYIHTNGSWKIVENDYVQEVNPELANSTFEEALVATNKEHLYVSKEGKVYDNELFKSWHDRYLKFLQRNPDLTDKCDGLKDNKKFEDEEVDL